jgi:hypothetical protein
MSGTWKMFKRDVTNLPIETVRSGMYFPGQENQAVFMGIPM